MKPLLKSNSRNYSATIIALIAMALFSGIPSNKADKTPKLPTIGINLNSRINVEIAVEQPSAKIGPVDHGPIKAKTTAHSYKKASR